MTWSERGGDEAQLLPYFRFGEVQRSVHHGTRATARRPEILLTGDEQMHQRA
jgi:hypothetical protein